MRTNVHTSPVEALREELVLWRSGAVIVVVTVLIGAVEGVIWALLAPGEQFVVYNTGQFLPLPTESYHQFTSIAIFALIGLICALALATAAWHWRSIRGATAVMVVVGANALGALTAYLVGPLLVSGVDPATIGASNVSSLVQAPPTLGNAMVIIVQPAIAVAVYTFLAAWNGHPDLARPVVGQTATTFD